MDASIGRHFDSGAIPPDTGKEFAQLERELYPQLIEALRAQNYGKVAELSGTLARAKEASGAGAAAAMAEKKTPPVAAEQATENSFAVKLRSEIERSSPNINLLKIFSDCASKLGLQNQENLKVPQRALAVITEVGKNPAANVSKEDYDVARNALSWIMTRGPIHIFLENNVFSPDNFHSRGIAREFVSASGWREIEMRPDFAVNLDEAQIAEVTGKGRVLDRIIRPGFRRGGETIKAVVSVK